MRVVRERMEESGGCEGKNRGECSGEGGRRVGVVRGEV